MQRWVKFAKYLPAEGWQPVIYTPSNPEQLVVDASLAGEVPAEAEVIKRKIVEPYAVYNFLVGHKGGGGGKGTGASKKEGGKEKESGAAGNGGGNMAGGAEVNPVNAGEKTLIQRFSMAVRGNCFIPDPRRLWVGPSVRFLKKYLKEHPVDIIVSTGPPQSMHLIGRKLALATGLPWIADFRDPWTKIFYFKHLSLSSWARRRHEKLERRVLDDATVVVAVSPLVQEDFRSMTSTPVELITNGYDEDDFRPERKDRAEADFRPEGKDGPVSGVENGAGTDGQSNTQAAAQPDGQFNLTHTGLFAADGNPETLWEVLARKCAADPAFRQRLRIRLVGKTDRQVLDSIRAAGLGENLVDRGYQPHEEAVREQREASVLMLPLRREPEYRAVLPGKVFEYLAADRPVLGIGQPDGAMAALLADCKAGTVADWDDRATVAGFIDRCWRLFTAGEPLSGAEDIARFSRRRLTESYVALFEALLSGDGGGKD